MIHIGAEPYRFARFGGDTRIDTATDFLAVDAEEYHRLHAHRLHDIQDRRELAILVAAAAPRLGDVLGPQAEYQFLADQRLVARRVRWRHRQVDGIGDAHAQS